MTNNFINSNYFLLSPYRALLKQILKFLILEHKFEPFIPTFTLWTTFASQEGWIPTPSLGALPLCTRCLWPYTMTLLAGVRGQTEGVTWPVGPPLHDTLVWGTGGAALAQLIDWVNTVQDGTPYTGTAHHAILSTEPVYIGVVRWTIANLWKCLV